MKGATQCAKRLKQLMRKLKVASANAPEDSVGDPLGQLILGIFSRDVPESKALAAMGRLRENVVDYNEMRVVSAIEMSQIVGGLPEARLKCEDLSRALNRIFAKEHCVSLDSLATMSKKDVVAYLDDLDGLEAYTRARIRLYGLGKHAIPLDAAMWAYARKTEIVDAGCTLEEAQTFLERQISDKDAWAFIAVFRKRAWGEMGAAVRKGAVEPICSVPPDRTSRNMLQMVAGGNTNTAPRDRVLYIAGVDEALAEPETPSGQGTVDAQPKKAKSASARKTSAKRRSKKTSGGARSASKRTTSKRTHTARSSQR
jgi:hypothetical protein